ncbi:MAG TPA: HD domain-containing protein [Solirubrobacterales bacterium]|nr:HD domain-containing protein [Solirubrobacterales bacterium]
MSSAPRIEAAAERSGLVRDALSLAREAHAGQLRNTGSDELPFIGHPVAVAEHLSREGFEDEVVAAGLLHDVVEHTDVTLEEVRDRFGEEVAQLVGVLTESEAIGSYEARKEEHRARVASAGPEAHAVFTADKTANVETLRAAYAVRGEEVDAELPVSLDVKIFVWELDLEMLFRAAPELPLVDRFADEMAKLWGQRATWSRDGLDGDGTHP